VVKPTRSTVLYCTSVVQYSTVPYCTNNTIQYVYVCLCIAQGPAEFPGLMVWAMECFEVLGALPLGACSQVNEYSIQDSE
jgi:hypothetical protein